MGRTYTLRNQRASRDFEYFFLCFFFVLLLFWGVDFPSGTYLDAVCFCTVCVLRTLKETYNPQKETYNLLRRRLLLYCVRVAHAMRIW